jgi:hypothetical protein
MLRHEAEKKMQQDLENYKCHIAKDSIVRKAASCLARARELKSSLPKPLLHSKNLRDKFVYDCCSN